MNNDSQTAPPPTDAVVLTINPLLALRLRMSREIPLLLL
jgi:hypothetical protein